MMRRGTVLGILVGLITTKAMAFVEPGVSPKGIKVDAKVMRPTLYQSDISAFSADGAQVSLDRRSNAVREMSGQDLLGVHVTGSSKKAFEQAALELISSQKDLFGVSPQDVEIISEGTFVDAQDQIVSMRVLRSGVSIQDAGITFQFKNGSLVRLKVETYSEATIIPSSNLNTQDVAAKALNSHGALSRGSSWRVKATGSGYALVRVDEYLVAGSDAPWLVQVDTSNGSLFEVRSPNLHLRGTAVATAYPRYFGEVLQDSALAHPTVKNITGSANELGEFESIDDTTAPTMEGLNGQYVSIRTKTGKDLTATAQKSNNVWNLRFDVRPTAKLWDNNDMAQTMVYVTVNRIVNYAKKFIQPTWFNTPLKANVNLAQHCNAHWSTIEGTINFYTSGIQGKLTCANTGLITDVVFHEWGHGLDANTGGIKDGAMSEGFGDALAALFTDDSRVGVDFLPLDRKPVRNLTDLKVYPKDVTGAVHSDGLIIGGSWYDLYNGLKKKYDLATAKDLYAKFLFKGIYAAPKMTDVYQATLTLDKVNDTDEKSPNFCVINAAFARHGLATADESCKS